LLSQLLDSSKDRNVIGWILFASANGIQNFSRELDQIAKATLLPRVQSLTSHSDPDIAKGATFVLRRFDGQLPYGSWNSLGAKSWNDFRK